jgi:hypothetical protein
LDLDPTKTIEDAKSKLPEIAHLLKKPRSLVHISETPAGIEGEVEITVLESDPFKDSNTWLGPHYPGESIVVPIEFATYDTAERGQLSITGKNGSSSEHYITMGMPGTGKSKVWQVIYGTVLNRKEVSVIYGDPAKGMQSGGPLASGLEWFEWTEEGCKAQIKAVMDAIPARTNHLTSRGLSHWQRGCELNFLIFHLEEAARFAEVSELIVLLEAARSAGIAVVISLQRASHDRIPTSARYNLGGSLCFGVKGKTDTTFSLSEYARESGATPHLWQNRFPGRFYMESSTIDQRLSGHPLMADWVNDIRLEQEVDAGRDIRTPLDTVTADALGARYRAYREEVSQGVTDWQDMRKNRGFSKKTLDFDAIEGIEYGDEPDTEVKVTQPTETRTVAVVKNNNLKTDPEDTARAIAEFNSILEEYFSNGKTLFTNKEIQSVFTSRSPGWVSKRLKFMQEKGLLEKTPEGFWRIVSL